MNDNANELIALRNLLLDGQLLDELDQKCGEMNIFDVLRISEMELRHSNMLSWLFDPNESHGLNYAVLKRLLPWIVDEEITTPEEAIKLLLMNFYSFSVRREWKSIDVLLISEEEQVIKSILKNIVIN